MSDDRMGDLTIYFGDGEETIGVVESEAIKIQACIGKRATSGFRLDNGRRVTFNLAYVQRAIWTPRTLIMPDRS